MHHINLYRRRLVIVIAIVLRSVVPANAGEPRDASALLIPVLRLSEAIREALQQGPGLRAADEALAVAEIRERLAESAFDVKISPSVNAATDAAGLERQDFGIAVTKQLQTGGEAKLSVDSFRYGSAGAVRDFGYSFLLTQPLLRGFGPSATSELVGARRAEAGAARARQDASQQLILTVAQAYFSVARLQRLVHAGEMALERAVKLRRASEARMKVGLATQLDVLRADLLVVESEASLGDQREMLAVSLDQLNILMGRPLNSPVDVAIDDGLELTEEAGFPTATGQKYHTLLLERALTNRHDIQEARDRITDAERMLRIARWNLLPQVDLNLAYAQRGLPLHSASLATSTTQGWRIGVSTSYSLDRSDQTAGASLATVTVEGARRRLLELEQRVESEVRSAVRAQERASATAAIQKKAVEVAERQLRLAELRYQRGLAGNFDVVDAESSLFRAHSALLSAQADRALTQLVLERTLGTLSAERFLQ
jgi:outer membrane protein TolC